MYANLQNLDFDPHRQYAFFRFCDESVLLIVANFDDKAAETEIIIPEDAFEALSLPYGKVTATDLYTNKKSELEMAPGEKVKVGVAANNATILEIKKTINKTIKHNTNQ